MDTVALLKAVAIIATVGVWQGYDHYRYLLTGNIAGHSIGLTPQEQKDRVYNECKDAVIQKYLMDIGGSDRPKEKALEDCKTQAYGGGWTIDKATSSSLPGGRYKWRGAWHYSNGQTMVNSREGCLTILNNARKFNRHGLNPAYEAKQTAHCNELYTEAEDKQYPQNTP